jgi:hypothetical protein
MEDFVKRIIHFHLIVLGIWATIILGIELCNLSGTSYGAKIGPCGQPQDQGCGARGGAIGALVRGARYTAKWTTHLPVEEEFSQRVFAE